MDHSKFIDTINKINGEFEFENEYQNHIQKEIFIGSTTEIIIDDNDFNSQKNNIDFVTELTNKIYNKFKNIWRIDMDYDGCWFEFKISKSGTYSKNLRHIYDFVKCILLIMLRASNNQQSSMVCFSKNIKKVFDDIVYWINIINENEIILRTNDDNVINLNLSDEYETIKKDICDLIHKQNYIIFNLESINYKLNIDDFIDNLVKFIYNLLENIFQLEEINNIDDFNNNLDNMIEYYEELDKNFTHEFKLDKEFENNREM